MARLWVPLLLSVVLGACGSGDSDATDAETTYGTPVDATTAFPAPAVAAEESLYIGHRVTIDGRIAAIRMDGCAMHLATDTIPLVVAAARTDAGSCAWQVPSDVQGFAVAAGTLRSARDTLRLTANGVRMTPVRLSSPDS